MEFQTDTASILGLGNPNKYRGKCVACETWVEIPPSETENWATWTRYLARVQGHRERH